jgi:hypothetical protein
VRTTWGASAIRAEEKFVFRQNNLVSKMLGINKLIHNGLQTIEFIEFENFS